MKQYNDLIADFWRDYAALLLLGAGLLGVIALVALGVWAKRSKKPLRPIALAVSMNLALLLNAEGMWVIAIDQLKLPVVFAVLVFAVFEICFLTATSLAAEQYRRTTVYAPDGKIVTPGHPGPMLYIAALIAVISGVIVASNAVTGTEKLLRLAVPCVIFLMWWAALTAAGQRVRRGRFAYSPRRLAERWGWLIPDDDPDLVRMAAERQVRRMVVNYHRVSGARWPQSWWRSRLLKDARTAGEPVVEDVIQQLARIQRVMDLLAPGGERFTVPAPSLRTEAGGPEPVTSGPAVAPVPEPLTLAASGPHPAKGDSGPVPGQAVPAVRFVQPVAAEEPPVESGPAGNGRTPDIVAEVPAPRRSHENDDRIISPPAVAPGQPAVAPGQPAVAPGQPAAVPSLSAVVADPPAADSSRPAGVPGPPVGVSGPPAGVSSPSAVVSGSPAAMPNPPVGVSSPPAGVSSQSAVVSGPLVAVPGPAAAVPGPVGAVPSSPGDAPGPLAGVSGLPAAAPNPPAPNPPAAVPAWAATPTGARPAVNVVGSPWWRLAVQNLRRLLDDKSKPDELIEMSYLQVTELARTLAPKVPELGEGVVRAFVIDYVRELSGEHGEAAYPWRDLLPPPALAAKGSPAWLTGLEALRSALEEELSQGGPRDVRELADLLAPSAPRLDDRTIRGFVTDYLEALSGQTGPSTADEWQHLLPRPQGGRGATDEEILEVYGRQLDEILRTTGRLSRYRVQSLTGVKSRVQADRIKATVEERVAAPA